MRLLKAWALFNAPWVHLAKLLAMPHLALYARQIEFIGVGSGSSATQPPPRTPPDNEPAKFR